MGNRVQPHVTPSVVDEELNLEDKPFPNTGTPALKGPPAKLRGLNQIDMHTYSQGGSTTNLNKVLEDQSPKGNKGSKKTSANNIPGIYADTMKRDSFPPYDGMGSEKHNSARNNDDKNSKMKIDLDESKSDNGYQNVFANIDGSRNNEDEKRFLTGAKGASIEKEMSNLSQKSSKRKLLE